MTFPSNFELDILEFIEMWLLLEGSICILSVLSAVIFKQGRCLIEGDD